MIDVFSRRLRLTVLSEIYIDYIEIKKPASRTGLFFWWRCGESNPGPDIPCMNGLLQA